MDGMKGSLESISGGVVRVFHSSAQPSRFGDAQPRVGDLEREAKSGSLDSGYDPEKAYLMSVVSGWAYAEGQTLADKMQHYGFEHGAYVQQFSVVNDAMLVVARAYLIRSQDGRTGVLAFRGTEPVNAMSWLTDADTGSRTFYEKGKVHHGFHTNVEALWNYIEAALRDAANGVAPAGNGASTAKLAPLEHFYITGHSLGGAMAVLAAAKIFLDERYATWRRLVRGVYTFGQPAVGDIEFANALSKAEAGDTRRPLAEILYRHEYGRDVVPVLPPTSVGKFVHFGQKRTTTSQDKPWETSDRLTRQTRALMFALASVAGAFVARRVLRFQPLDGRLFSIDDHLPNKYINTSKISLEKAGEKEEGTRPPGPIERVRRIAHSAAEVGRSVLRGKGAAPPPPA